MKAKKIEKILRFFPGSAPNSGRSTPVSMVDNKNDVTDTIEDDDDDDVIPISQSITSTTVSTPNSLIASTAITTTSSNALTNSLATLKSTPSDVNDSEGKSSNDDTAAKDKEVRFKSKFCFVFSSCKNKFYE